MYDTQGNSPHNGWLCLIGLALELGLGLALTLELGLGLALGLGLGLGWDILKTRMPTISSNEWG